MAELKLPVLEKGPKPPSAPPPAAAEGSNGPSAQAVDLADTLAKQTRGDSTDHGEVLQNLAESTGEIPFSSLRVDMSDASKARIAQLHDPSKVGKDQYGEGLVNKHHKGKNTLSEHEAAQAQAYQDLQQKIDAGLVDPSTIPTEMCLRLGVKPDLESVPPAYDAIAGRVNEEVRTFLEQGDLTQEEFAAISGEITEFTNLYGGAYGKENIPAAYELVRDNARKLVYQHMIDKTIFSGSDHGVRHIVNGNIRFAKQMMESLREKGVVVSLRDEVIIHQVMIDHDLGYTTGAAQAPKGFEASKDHPLVSARFIEGNKAYYINRFGEDGYRSIHDAVLNHSYPRLEYQSDGQEVAHNGLIRGISSTVDSLGVTVETKTPEFFWNKDAIRTLLKIRLAMETMNGEVPDTLMGRYRQELIGVAQQEQNPDRVAGYENAITNFFNEVTADNTLGHYTGVVRAVAVEEVPGHAEEGEAEVHDHGHGSEDKRFRVVVEMTPTEVYALLGNMFGDKLAAQSFVKVVKDLGLDHTQLEAHARAVRRTGKRGESAQTLDMTSDSAHVRVGSELLEDQSGGRLADILDGQKIQNIAEVFHEVELLSVRTEINELLDEMDSRGTETSPEIQARFEWSITGKTTADEARQLNDLLISLSDPSSAGQKDDGGADVTVSQMARQTLKGFLTAQERVFLGV